MVCARIWFLGNERLFSNDSSGALSRRIAQMHWGREVYKQDIDAYVWFVLFRKVFQPAAQQVERVQCYGYVRDVFSSNLIQTVAQQLERIQSDEYGTYVPRVPSVTLGNFFY